MKTTKGAVTGNDIASSVVMSVEGSSRMVGQQTWRGSTDKPLPVPGVPRSLSVTPILK